MPGTVEAPATRRMSGYFTLFGFLRGQSLTQLERRIGYREGRLSSKGALIYKFLRLPQISEFEVRGMSTLTDDRWRAEVAPKRAADLAAVAAYHRNTKVPSFDEIQRRNALESMSLTGGNMLVKVYPVDWQKFDDTPAGYRVGSGIYQWRLKDNIMISGALLARLNPGGLVPTAL